jgi:DNA-binding protein YbaB
MTSAFDHAMSDVLANLARKREDLARIHGSMDEVTNTVRSRRRQVSVTVDGRGEILDLKFHGQSYKSMDPADLAKLILDTIREAREEARAQMWAAVGEIDPEGAEFGQAASMVDWSQRIEASLSLPQQLLDLLDAPAENFMDGAQFSELMAILSGGSNAMAENRVEGDGTASSGRGASDEGAAKRPPDKS